VNVHCYSRRTAGQAIPVNIRLEKMNPYKLVSFRDVELKETGSEETVFRFGIDKEGNISYVTEGPKRSLIKKKDAP